MDFVIIYPPSDYSRPHRPYLPLGGLYLAEALARSGYTVAILDGTLDSIAARLETCVASRTLAFGISTMSGFSRSIPWLRV